MPDLTDTELAQLLRDAQERADSYPFEDYILEVAIPLLVAEVRRLRSAVAAAEAIHAEKVDSHGFKHCPVCRDGKGWEFSWPCDTYRAMHPEATDA